MKKISTSRFVTAQGRFSPYNLAGAYKFMEKRGIKPRTVSDLLHSITEMLTVILEEESGKIFEDNEEALTFCSSNLSISTRSRETQRVKQYKEIKGIFNSPNTETNQQLIARSIARENELKAQGLSLEEIAPILISEGL